MSIVYRIQSLPITIVRLDKYYFFKVYEQTNNFVLTFLNKTEINQIYTSRRRCTQGNQIISNIFIVFLNYLKNY